MGDSKPGNKAARAGSKQPAGYRRRAVGTRDKIISHLALVAEVIDDAGMASTRLAESVAYPGSSVAFAQLLSGMERDGLIAREVRGKRTYRIALTAQGKQRERASGAGDAPARGGSASARRSRVNTRSANRTSSAITNSGMANSVAAPGEFDYDELARRLLVQVVRRLAASPGEITDLDPGADHASLEDTVAGLERELATAWTRHGTLTAENMKLRQQLREAQRNLDLERRARRGPVTDELNRAEAVLLDRLLSPADDGRQSGTNAS